MHKCNNAQFKESKSASLCFLVNVGIIEVMTNGHSRNLEDLNQEYHAQNRGICAIHFF